MFKVVRWLVNITSSSSEHRLTQSPIYSLTKDLVNSGDEELCFILKESVAIQANLEVLEDFLGVY